MYIKQLGMDDKISLISASDNIKTSEKYDFMIDMEVKKMLEVIHIFNLS
jgi:ATP-dependent metalloprotease